MKAILMSIRPQHVANILNGLKTLEIRKHFPKDYVGWVYIYCTKGYQDRLYFNGSKYIILPRHALFDDICFNGKVVARFWCDKVEEIKYHFGYYDMSEWTESYILENSCLSAKELDDYLQASKEYDETKVSRVYGYAINITKVEPFDKPKEIKEFYTTKLDKQLPELFDNSIQLPNGTWVKSLTRAPQNWCYVEV